MQLLLFLSLISLLDNLHIKQIFHQIFMLLHIYVPLPIFPISWEDIKWWRTEGDYLRVGSKTREKWDGGENYK